jgi:hypothetical protein
MRRLAFSWLAALVLGLASATAWASAPAGVTAAAPQPPAQAASGALASTTSAIIATASPTATVLITAVDVQAFPDLTVYVAVNDAAGQHVAQLPPAAFSLTENSAAIPADKLAVAEKKVGIQAVFALDTSAPFKARDANAITRLDYIKQALLAFGAQSAPPGAQSALPGAQSAPPSLADGIDDVTLLTPEGIRAAHTSQGSEFSAALSTYTTTFSGAANPLPLINQALDFASETMPRPGMPRYVVLFSNGIIINGQAASLTDLVARAQGAQVAIYTVYVGPGGTSDSVGGQSLRKLAELTGGRFLVLEKPESLTPLLSHLADQRVQYQLRYRSGMAVTGQQSFTAQVRLPDGSQMASNPAAFPLRIEAPTLTFSSLPSIIQLGASASASAVISYSVPVAVDFPDGHPRRLQSLELVADGQVVDQQLAPEGAALVLQWNVSGYTTGGSHTLLARVVDELGFRAESAPLSVTLSFGAPAALAIPTIATAGATVSAAPAPAFTPFMVVGMGLLAVAVVIGAGGLWWARQTARARPGTPPPGEQAQPPARGKVSARDRNKTAPLPAHPSPAAPPTLPPSRPSPRPSAFSFHTPALFPKKRPAVAAKPLGKAYLEVIEGGGAPRDAIEILGPVLRLGRDATRAEVVFQDRSMSRLHARIVEAPEGAFRIYDEGSTSGTWVNFTQIPAEGGWELKSGDLVNLGRIQLRFKRRAEVSGQTAPAAGPGVKPSGPDQPAPDDGATVPYRPLRK